MLTNLGINSCSLCLHNSKRLPVISKQDIIGKAFTSRTGFRHTDNRIFYETVLTENPTHCLDINVDDALASFCLAHAVRIEVAVLLIKLTHCRHLILQSLHLLGHRFTFFGTFFQRRLEFLKIICWDRLVVVGSKQ